MELGNFVKVKKGIKDPDYQEFDMSDWTGVISKKIAIQDNGLQLVEVQWDMKTLEKLPIKFIKDSIEDGCEFDAMNLGKEDIHIIENREKDNPKERRKLVIDLESKYDYIGFDDDDKRIAEILNSNNVAVNKENLKTYRTYLIENLKGRILLTGIEDFSWEERFVFGYGSEREYAQLRKTNPSYKDTFKLVKILSVDKYDYDRDLFAKVQRQEDRKTFEIPLSQLECIDEKSDNYALLDEFSVWVVNY